ncbi:testis-expressed protein 52 isoform X1 [Sarcophilus harrisii]|uniref:testis-expressed protein 52 isoform X1 n=1 Tax=Sarcophilus harrisii TaxID=9305 RepID=UPI000273BE15|nr:testis-expressed protein 52 isoform X1 [Sarcophilus harrisii]
MTCCDDPITEETWVEREYLHPDIPFVWGGFTPKPYHHLAVKQPSSTRLKSVTHRQLLSPWKDPTQHTWGYHTWVDVGRLPPVFPSKPDKTYDSNVWRWLTRTEAHKCSFTKYCIPPPSYLGKNTLLRFIDTHPIFTDPERKNRVVTQTKKEITEAGILKSRSEARVPPLDGQGNILPPPNFKRYRHVSPGGRLDPGFQLISNPVPNLLCRGWPCPNPQPHYKEMSMRLLLQPAPPLDPEMVRNYQILAKDRAATSICHVAEELIFAQGSKCTIRKRVSRKEKVVSFSDTTSHRRKIG